MASLSDRYRLLVLGAPAVGKTCIIRKYLYNDFLDKHKETVEDLHSRDFHIAGRKLPLDILETNYCFTVFQRHTKTLAQAQKNFASHTDMRKVAVASCDAIMLVFAVDDVVSFRQMADLWEEVCQLRAHRGLALMPTVLVGNKIDSPNRKILPETVEAWLSLRGTNADDKLTPKKYVDVCAKTGQNLVEAFKSLFEQSEFAPPKETDGVDQLCTLLADTSTPAQCPNCTTKDHKSLMRATSNPPMDDQLAARSPLKLGKGATKHLQIEGPNLSLPLSEAGSSFKRSRSTRRSARVEKHHNGGPLAESMESNGDNLKRTGSLFRRGFSLRRKQRPIIQDLPDESDCVIS